MKEANRNKKGRPKNSKNVISETARSSFNLLLKNNLEKLQSDLDDMDSKDRVSAVLQIAKFILPTLKAVDVTPETRNMFKPVQLNFSNEEE